jgi:tetratricopeptide (TPR) repeat protein
MSSHQAPTLKSWMAAVLVLAPLALGARPSNAQQEPRSPALAQANADLQAGEVDKVLAELNGFSGSGGDQAALAHNLACRARFAAGQFDAAVTECEQAVKQEPNNSDFHLWLGRATGEKADKASFVNAYGLAKKARGEFEEAVRLNPRNVEALDDLGDFYRQAPGVVGGGVDKAQNIAAQLDKIDAARAHKLRGHIAGQQKDFATEEKEFKLAVSVDPHSASSLTSLASFYARRKQYDQMDAAIKGAVAAAKNDKHQAVALYDSAGLLIKTDRDAAMAASLLDTYLASPGKTEEAPAFAAHIQLARLRAKSGDAAGAERERQAALALAHEYKPAVDFHAQAGS